MCFPQVCFLTVKLSKQKGICFVLQTKSYHLQGFCGLWVILNTTPVDKRQKLSKFWHEYKQVFYILPVTLTSYKCE